MQNTRYTLHPTRYTLNKAGFTLLEILVALAISSIALIVILQLFSANMRSVSISEDYVSAVIKAEAEMREILDNPNLAEGSWSEITPDGYRIDVFMSNAETERTQNLRIGLLDVTLTINWTKGAKAKSFTLRTQRVVNKQI